MGREKLFLSKQHLWSHWQRCCSAPRQLSYQNKWTKVADRPRTFQVPTTLLLEKCLSIAASWTKKSKGKKVWVQCRRNLVLGIFCESKLSEARFNFLLFYDMSFNNVVYHCSRSLLSAVLNCTSSPLVLYVHFVFHILVVAITQLYYLNDYEEHYRMCAQVIYRYSTPALKLSWCLCGV